MKQEIGRLAFRVEGEFWNAYWARSQHSMEDALLLGSIRLNRVESHPVRKSAFMALMRAVIADVSQEVFSTRTGWKRPRQAPEHERGGRA